jgi:hypothetical protein|tara:strand:- start:3543 stop:3926 length:384 start_codon:yes stop_codon:yes gene_type:complete
MKFLLIILIFLPLTLFGQQLKCCETENEVRELVIGKWKAEKFDSNTFFEYFGDSSGIQYKIYNFDENGKLWFNEGDMADVEILRYEDGFKLKYSTMFEEWISELKYLNSTKMILITDGEEIIYHKAD